MEKLYRQVKLTDDQEDTFAFPHKMAMTGEKLHSKSEIAYELGVRDRRVAELEKSRNSSFIANLRGDAIVMANARRLIKANVRTSNGRLYSELFGTGCGSGRDGCRQLGLNPDCNKTSYEKMCDHISAKALKENK
jgi:hypothetical protein